MLKRIRAFTFGLILAVAISGLPGAPPARAQTPASSPYAMLLTYYNRINLGDFQGAYTFWLNPIQTLEDFTVGFADSRRITPYFGQLQPGTTNQELGRIPVVLLGYHTDGGKVNYAGCASVTSDNGNWRLLKADFKLISSVQFLALATIEQFLQVDCYNVAKSIQIILNDKVNDGAWDSIVTYYDLINHKQFAPAYDMWLKPLPGPKPNGAPATDYRLPFARFVDGYKDSGYINVFLGDYQNDGASAGHSYLDGILPVALLDQHTDGSVVAFYGCYVIGVLPTGGLGIVNGNFIPVPQGAADIPLGSEILQYLKPEQCPQPLQF